MRVSSSDKDDDFAFAAATEYRAIIDTIPGLSLITAVVDDGVSAEIPLSEAALA